jgi:hypothetical protein
MEKGRGGLEYIALSREEGRYCIGKGAVRLGLKIRWF